MPTDKDHRMSLDIFLNKLNEEPETVTFENTMAIIEKHYEFKETAFSNGESQNSAGENNGSCKIFSFGYLNGLTEDQTLHCFGNYYRKDVLNNPEGKDHQNIRNFINQGWQGVKFEDEALILK